MAVRIWKNPHLSAPGEHHILLDELPAKVQSGRVRMTAIRGDGGTNEQIPVPLAELNDLTFRLPPSHSVAPVGLWSRSTLDWRSPQFFRADVVAAWPARNRKTAAASAAILRHLRSIMSAEAPLTKLEAQKRGCVSFRAC